MDEPPAFEVDAEIIGSQEVTANGHVACTYQLRSAPVTVKIDPRNRQPLVWPEDMNEEQVKALIGTPLFRLRVLVSGTWDDRVWQMILDEQGGNLPPEWLTQVIHPGADINHLNLGMLKKLLGPKLYAVFVERLVCNLTKDDSVSILKLLASPLIYDPGD